MAAWTRWSIAIAAGALALACETTPAPRDAIAEADGAISRARSHDAEQYAPLKLREAEDKLEKAREMARDDDHDQRVTARRLAEQAQVDAELALVQSEKAQAELNVDEMQRTVRALEGEIDHELD